MKIKIHHYFIYLLIFNKSVCSQNDTAVINELNQSAAKLLDVKTDSAAYLAQKAYDLSKTINYKKGEANALANLAVSNDIKGNSAEAIKQFIEAIKLFETLNDIQKLGSCYSQMGICYFLQYQYDNALACYEKSIALFKHINSEKDIAGVLINQGIVYTYQDKYSEAEKNYLSALDIYTKLNLVSGFAPVYNSLAKIYYYQKKYTQAISYYKLAEKFNIQFNNKYQLITNYNSLAACFRDIKDLEQAKIYSQKSIDLSVEIGATERELFCQEVMASILFELGDYKNAYLSYKKYADLKDTVFTSDKNQAIAEMQAKFDVEKNKQKVKEIELQKKIDDEKNTKQRIVFVVVIIIILILLLLALFLYKNKQKINTLLKQKNIAIQTNLEQKEIMMGEIHHRVKNNLQMVSSILDLQSRDLKDEKLKQIIEDSLSRINAISLIHQRLYQSDNIRGVKINTYLDELTTDIITNFTSESQHKIQISFNVDDLDMDLESAIPIGLITAELVTNACKYAFKDKANATINIQLHKQDTWLNLSVADNGIGKSANTINANSFGTKLIKSLSRKLRAELNEQSSEHGTIIYLKITNFKLYGN